MTLFNILESMKIRKVEFPHPMGDLEVSNYNEENFCPFGLKAYLNSKSFTDDISDCVGDYDEAIALNRVPTLLFYRKGDGKLGLKIRYMDESTPAQ